MWIGESIMETALRETEEEAGFNSGQLKVLPGISELLHLRHNIFSAFI